MAWLRWRSKSSSSAGCWAWTHFKGVLVDGKMKPDLKSDVESFLEERATEHSWSEHHRGIEWHIHDDGYAPRWVIDRQLNELVSGHVQHVERYTDQLQTLTIEKMRSTVCPQCEEADTAVDTFRVATELCPRCGRAIVKGSLSFYLMPTMMPGCSDADDDALTLLRDLVAKPRFSSRGAHLTKKSEQPAMQILVDRGLAGGSYGPGNKSEMHATDKGKAEVERHQAKPPCRHRKQPRKRKRS